MDAIKELKEMAEARGLRVEEDGNEFYLLRGEEHIVTLWYLDEYESFTDQEPGQDLEELLDHWAPKKKKKVRRTSLYYSISFRYGSKTAPEEPPEGAVDVLLDNAAKLVKKVAPGAVKVEVTTLSQDKPKSRKLS